MKLSFVIFFLVGTAFASSQKNPAPLTVNILCADGAYKTGNLFIFLNNIHHVCYVRIAHVIEKLISRIMLYV